MIETVKDFVSNLVNIDLIEDSDGNYGHYPFQLFVEKEDGTFEMNTLDLGGDVLACYKRVAIYAKDNAKKIFLSLDFPSGGDIEHDFVCVYSIVDSKFDIYAIPYNTETGEKYEEIHQSELLDKIFEQFKKNSFTIRKV